MKVWFLSFLMILAFATLHCAHNRDYQSPVEAAMDQPEIQDYLAKGYKLHGTQTHPIDWQRSPTQDYSWGFVTLDLMGHRYKDGMQETHYVTLTCKIKHSPEKQQTGSYRVQDVNTIGFTAAF